MTPSTLYSETHGRGDAVLLVAGVASDSPSWQLQTMALSQTMRAIVFPNRGVGRSPLTGEALSIESMASDAIEILDRYQLEKVHVVGHSMGTAIAQTMAKRHPERISKMVLASPIANLDAKSRIALEAWVLALKEEVSHELFCRLLFPWLFSEQFLAQPGNFEFCCQSFECNPYPITPAGIEAQVAALSSSDSRGWLATTQTPTLVLTGERDLLTPPEQAQSITSALADAEFTEIPRVGHSSQVEDADFFNRTVLNFLAR